MNILLFDMDGVLLEPHGYHRALAETVRLIAKALGFGSLTVSDEDISAFESSGVTSEWDSSAICAALLLKAIWRVNPAASLPDLLPADGYPEANPPDPGFQTFAKKLGDPDLLALRPLERADRLLVEQENHLRPDQRDAISAILGHARAAQDSLTHCTFQELVLGSRMYTEIYRRPARLGAASYLMEYDRPRLSPGMRQALFAWLEQPGNRAAIFTNRPSQPLEGVFSTPEAELGTRLVGVEDLPIAGLGGLLWLASQRKRGPQAFLKPSPVHFLAGLALSLGYPTSTALLEVANLALDQQVHELWKELHGSRVTAFEDTAGGLQSAKRAAEILAKAGISIEISLCGISGNPSKIEALQAVGGRVYADINAALGPILG
jgi:phosphoglycolate phosphatase-like HAD superfamily hydrolase